MNENNNPSYSCFKKALSKKTITFTIKITININIPIHRSITRLVTLTIFLLLFSMGSLFNDSKLIKLHKRRSQYTKEGMSRRQQAKDASKKDSAWKVGK